MAKKVRIDTLLVDKDLAEDRGQAGKLIMAGAVRANGQLVPNPSSKVEVDATITIDELPRYVSRGGDKLAAAVDVFGLNLNGFVCADVGSSTGGFTDVMLQNGASKVYAIDVGKGLLHWKLRNDERVIVMEEMNARKVESLPEKIDFAAVDVSFISLRVLLPVIRKWFGNAHIAKSDDENTIVCLVKPQFEAERDEVSKGKGVIWDSDIHARVLGTIMENAIKMGFGVLDLIRSPKKGPKGNIEFLLHLSIDQSVQRDNNALIQKVVPNED